MRADQLEREYPVQIEWTPWELHPDTPPEGRTRTPRPGASVVKEAARAAGLTLRSPEVIANSRLALEAAEFVKQQAPNRFDVFHRALFVAYFEDGRNIGLPDVLLDIARACEVDADALGEALRERAYQEQVDEEIAWAHASGIGSTPTYVFDSRVAVIGAQEYAVFEDVMGRLGVARRT